MRSTGFLRSPLALFAIALAAPGCFAVNGASSNATPFVKVQASSDLDCPQSQIRVTKEWGGKFEVVGCGQKVTYDTSCNGIHCTAAPLGQVVPYSSRPDPSPSGTDPFPAGTPGQ
jgi:hypothetical protein